METEHPSTSAVAMATRFSMESTCTGLAFPGEGGAMLDVLKGVAWGNPPMFGPASDWRPLQGFLIGGFTISLQNKAF